MNNLNFNNIKINKISDNKLYKNIHFVNESHDVYENDYSNNDIDFYNNQDDNDINVKLPLEIYYNDEIDSMIKNTKRNRNINKLPTYFVYKAFYLKEYRKKYKINYLPEIIILSAKAWNKESDEMKNEVKKITQKIIYERNIN